MKTGIVLMCHKCKGIIFKEYKIYEGTYYHPSCLEKPRGGHKLRGQRG